MEGYREDDADAEAQEATHEAHDLETDELVEVALLLLLGEDAPYRTVGPVSR